MKLRTALLAAVHDINRAQRLLFDDLIRLDYAADPADLPHVPLTWRRTVTGWELTGTVLPGAVTPGEGHSPGRRPC